MLKFEKITVGFPGSKRGAWAEESIGAVVSFFFLQMYDIMYSRKAMWWSVAETGSQSLLVR